MLLTTNQLLVNAFAGFIMKSPNFLVIVAILLLSTQTHALIGYGIEMYNPNCAFACRGAIASAMLSCSDMAAMGGMTHHGGSAMTTAECRANDTSFLTTLAWCMSSTCAEYKVETWKLEKYWLDKTTGEPEVMPKWGYTETLGKIKEAPEAEWNEEDTLNFTALVAHETWDTQRLTMANFELAETLHSRYG